MTDTPTGAVTGELVSTNLAAVQPTTEAINADRSNRKARTAQQAFPSAAGLGLIIFYLRLKGVDLNPAPGEQEIPGEVLLQAGAFLTWLSSVVMNRRQKDAETAETAETADGDELTIGGRGYRVVVEGTSARLHPTGP